MKINKKHEYLIHTRSDKTSIGYRIESGYAIAYRIRAENFRMVDIEINA